MQQALQQVNSITYFNKNQLIKFLNSCRVTEVIATLEHRVVASKMESGTYMGSKACCGYAR